MPLAFFTGTALQPSTIILTAPSEGVGIATLIPYPFDNVVLFNPVVIFYVFALDFAAT